MIIYIDNYCNLIILLIYKCGVFKGGKNKVVEEFTPGRNETFSRNVRLVMTLPNKIIRNTNFLLKLNIHCASLKHSIFGIVPVSIINPPHSLKLEVSYFLNF